MPSFRRYGYAYQAAKAIYISQQYQPFSAREMVEKGFIENKQDIKKLQSQGLVKKISRITPEVRYSIWRLNHQNDNFWQK
jgi:hypothetical protein